MVFLLLTAGWIGGFGVGVDAEAPSEAYLSPDELTYDSEAEFLNSSDETTCTYTELEESWCEPIEIDVLGLSDTQTGQWFDAKVQTWLYHFTNGMFQAIAFVVNSVAPFAYWMKTTFGEQTAVMVGQGVSYLGIGGFVVGQLWRVKRSWNGGGD